MNQITELPEWTDYGHDFNYAQWTANTEVSLHNVNWNSTYRDTWYSDNGQKGVNDWLDNNAGPSIQVPGVTYHRPGQSIKLPIPYGVALEYNYLRAYNPPQPGQVGDKGRYYYYFIRAVGHVNPGTTEFMLQLDVWQSYIYDVEMGNCFINRGHIGIAAENNFEDNGRSFLTVPEGLDVGNEYVIKELWSRAIASARRTGTGYSILVLSTVSLKQDPGEPGNINLQSATGNGMQNLPNGTEAYVFRDQQSWFDFLNAYKDKPWITQGIISVRAIPRDMGKVYNLQTKEIKVGSVTLNEVQPTQLNTVKTQLKDAWRDWISQYRIPSRYRHLKKFFTSPYMYLELTTNTGSPIMLKPECLPGNDLEVVEVAHFAEPGPRIMFYPHRYNAEYYPEDVPPPGSADSFGIINDNGEFLDMATGIFNFPTFSLTNNGYMSFMAANAASINYQHDSAGWQLDKSMAGNQLGYNQASAGVDLARDMTGINIDASRASTTLNQQTSMMRGGLNAVSGALGAATPWGAVGAAAGSIAGTAIDLNQQEQSFGISSNQARRATGAQTGNMEYVRDSNKQFADFASGGDYQNAIAGINAKVQDARAIQPTTSGQVGGEAFLLTAYQWGYDVKVKFLQSSAVARIGDYWLRYGYAINRFGRVPKNFKCMSNFTYWKLTEAYITAARCPEGFKDTIRGILEKGVTVWTNPQNIGRIDLASNTPVKGIKL